MTINKKDLEAAVNAGLLQPYQVDPLFAFLLKSDSKSGKARFNGTHVFYYLGGMMAIGAASLFTGLVVEALGMVALFILSVLYALLAMGIAGWFEKREFGVPAGIFATLAITLTPLAVFALQHVLGMWPSGGHAAHYRDYHVWIDWRWLIMELSTLAVGAVMLWRFRYPFLVMPIAITLWYMGMDIVPALLMNNNLETDAFSGPAMELRKRITLIYGFVMLAFAFYIDLRSRHSEDYAYWLYLFGIMTFWGALSSMGTGQLSGKLIYLLINFLMVFAGAILGRRVFAVFGGIGMTIVLGDLSRHIFKDSISFLVVLTLLGFGLIAIGVWWSKHETEIVAKMRGVLPQGLRELLEARTG